MTPQRARFLSASAAAAISVALAAGCSSGDIIQFPQRLRRRQAAHRDRRLALADRRLLRRRPGLPEGLQPLGQRGQRHGGILGRQVKLDVLNDNSSPTQVVTNYQKLITVDKVDLTFGPFSSLLTAPAAATAHRYGFAFVEGAGGAGRCSRRS